MEWVDEERHMWSFVFYSSLSLSLSLPEQNKDLELDLYRRCEDLRRAYRDCKTERLTPREEWKDQQYSG